MTYEKVRKHFTIYQKSVVLTLCKPLPASFPNPLPCIHCCAVRRSYLFAYQCSKPRTYRTSNSRTLHDIMKGVRWDAKMADGLGDGDDRYDYDGDASNSDADADAHGYESDGNYNDGYGFMVRVMMVVMMMIMMVMVMMVMMIMMMMVMMMIMIIMMAELLCGVWGKIL